MELNELYLSRRSVRKYEDKPVSAKQIKELMEATLMAPTWKNSETGRYYVAITPEAIAKVRETLPAFNQNSTVNASYIITTFVKNVSGFTQGKADNELGNEWGAYDLGLQNAFMLLKAREMGLDTLIMGLRDSEAIRAAFSIPEEEEIAAVISIGYRAEEPHLRARKAVEEVYRILD